MRGRELLREILAASWAQKVSATMVVVLVGAMCLTTLLTVGRSAAAEIQVQQRMDSAGSRVVTVHDTGEEELLNIGAVAVVAGLGVVETAVGLGAARDVSNGAVGTDGPRVPARTFTGDLASVLVMEEGRWPRPGEALVSASAQNVLSMDEPYGYVLDGAHEYPVVGRFRPLASVEELDGGIVIHSPTGIADYLTVVATDAATVDQATALTLSTLAPIDTSRIRVESPQSLAQVQQQVAGDLGEFSRGLLIGVLSAGAILVAIVVLSDVLVRRTDLGRRRALGAARATITALVAGRTIAPALLGAVLGTFIGLLLTRQMGTMPPISFAVGTAILAVLAALVAALPPALYAANRDPVTVLRTP